MWSGPGVDGPSSQTDRALEGSAKGFVVQLFGPPLEDGVTSRMRAAAVAGVAALGLCGSAATKVRHTHARQRPPLVGLWASFIDGIGALAVWSGARCSARGGQGAGADGWGTGEGVLGAAHEADGHGCVANGLWAFVRLGIGLGGTWRAG